MHAHTHTGLDELHHDDQQKNHDDHQGHHLDHHHDHHGHHGHHHHEHRITSLNAAFVIGISLNMLYVVIEAVYGIIYGSMGLLSDAGHNLSDVAALLLAMVAFRLARRHPDARHTYGYRKFTIQASFINALILCVAVGAIIFESIDKIIHPTAVDGDAIAWVAGVGVVVNGITTWLFMRHKKGDLNVKGAFLHMLADTLVSVGVVVSGIIIHYTGWYMIDPIIGLAIALFIGISTKNLLVESFKLSIDQVPEGIDMEKLEKDLTEVAGVDSVHHIHVWALSTTENAMTLHAVVEEASDPYTVISEIHHVASDNGISHTTVEPEQRDHPCHDAAMFADD